jgi:hypothetical protein
VHHRETQLLLQEVVAAEDIIQVHKQVVLEVEQLVETDNLTLHLEQEKVGHKVAVEELETQMLVEQFKHLCLEVH